MRDRSFETRSELEAYQLGRLQTLLAALVDSNPFQGPRIRSAGLLEGRSDGRAVPSLTEFVSRMPFTTKAELVADQERNPPYGTNLTHPLEAYTRMHATSSTTGRTPLRWMDTPESWTWLMDGWEHTLTGAGVTARDRVMFAFSFGPFIGFWVGFDAAVRLGCTCLPGGGLSSAARFELLEANAATVLCCTPTYALHLGASAFEAGADPSATAVDKVIVAGEPGGCVPATRARIERLWGAEVFDHYGMTEVGPVTYQLPGHPDRAYLIESNYLVEIVDPEASTPTPPGELGELVLTTLGRTGSPLLRYRTGDLVRECTAERAPDETVGRRLAGGILARRDHMASGRGVNVYPAAIDQVVRGRDGVAEYRIELDRAGAHREGAMTEVRLRIEPEPGCADPEALRRVLEQDLRTAFHLRIPVILAAAGELPRFELKARRWVEVDA